MHIAEVFRVVADPESREAASGTQVVNARVVFNQAPRQGVEQEAIFARATFFGAQGQRAADRLHKGDNVFLTGSFQIGSWTNPNTNETKPQYDIIVNSFRDLASKAASSTEASTAPTRTARKAPVVAPDNDLPF